MKEIQNAKLLLVDDNPDLRTMVTDILKRDGFREIVTAGSCQQAKALFDEQKMDFIILDVMLPDGDGFSLLSYFRQQADPAVPVLFLSARDEDRDRLYGLGLGADDYMTKPFLPEELILRIKSILRRTYTDTISNQNEPDNNEELVLGERIIHFSSAMIEAKNRNYELTAKEIKLLRKLNDNRGNIVTFDAICQTLWGDCYYGYENSLMVHIRRLREKVEENPSKPQWIITVRGIGYKLEKGESR